MVQDTTISERSEIKLGDLVTIPVADNGKIWTVVEFHERGQVTCKRTIKSGELIWAGYTTMKKGLPLYCERAIEQEEVFIQLATVHHLKAFNEQKK